jgi:hypothetical protein
MGGKMIGYSNCQAVTDSFTSNPILLFLYVPHPINLITPPQSTNINDSKPSPTRIPVPNGRLKNAEK